MRNSNYRYGEGTAFGPVARGMGLGPPPALIARPEQTEAWSNREEAKARKIRLRERSQ